MIFDLSDLRMNEGDVITEVDTQEVIEEGNSKTIALVVIRQRDGFYRVDHKYAVDNT